MIVLGNRFFVGPRLRLAPTQNREIKLTGKIMMKKIQVRKDWIVTLLLACFMLAMTGSVSAAAKARATSSATSQDSVLPLEEVQRFSTTISHIKNFYVEPIEDKKLFEDAIRGMLTGLDPHSNYLNKEEFADLKVSTSGEYGGLGIEITMDDGYVKVISPLDDTPAQLAGIKAGDLIVKIDGKPVKGMTLREAVKHMRGKAGKSIKLTIMRKKAKKNPLVFKLVRKMIHIRTVKSKLYDKTFGYIRISHFQSPTAKDLYRAVKKLKKQAGGKLQGVILDLRNNPGGLLDSAIDISDSFLNVKQDEKQLIVFTKGRAPGSEYEAHATPGDLVKGAPIVILINEGSASGSEIVAGALQDHKRGIVVGTKSFGKGSVQTVLPLDEEHGLKLTTARYYTPKGRSIQADGIKPDIVVEALQLSEVEDAVAKELSITEADLQGHLENDKHKPSMTKNKKGKHANQDKAEMRLIDKKLAKKDYQLFEALNILKGLSILHHHHPK